MSRLRRVALLPLALLCVFTIGAGTAAARLLPARLALFPLPSAATCGLAAPGPVVRAASGAVQGATGRVPGSEPPRPGIWEQTVRRPWRRPRPPGAA